MSKPPEQLYLADESGSGYCPECGAEANGFMTRVGTSTVYARFCVSCRHIEEIDIEPRSLPTNSAMPNLLAVTPLTDEAVIAQRDRALDLIEQLVALVPVTSMASHAAQESLHGANALLAESGRGQPDRFVESTLAWAAKQEGR